MTTFDEQELSPLASKILDYIRKHPGRYNAEDIINEFAGDNPEARREVAIAIGALKFGGDVIWHLDRGGVLSPKVW